VPSRFSAIAAMRKEVRTVVVSTATHIVDRIHRQTGVTQLKLDQLVQAAVGLLAGPIDDRPTCCGPLHLAGDLLANLERTDSNVRTNRRDELPGIVRQCLDRLENDTSDRTTPPRMYGSDVSARGMSDQDWHAIGGPRRDRVSGDACDERVPLGIEHRRRVIGCRDLSNEVTVNLALLEQAVE
jgi:hypothetical protein